MDDFRTFTRQGGYAFVARRLNCEFDKVCAPYADVVQHYAPHARVQSSLTVLAVRSATGTGLRRLLATMSTIFASCKSGTSHLSICGVTRAEIATLLHDTADRSDVHLKCCMCVAHYNINCSGNV